MKRSSGWIQFSKYSVVGLLSNLMLYVAYLFITSTGVGPKLAMSIVYGAGVAQTFIFNKRWSFAREGAVSVQFVKYCVAYGVGFIVNFFLLMIFVDFLGLAHQMVQAVTIVIVAIVVFVMQKHWVFK